MFERMQSNRYTADENFNRTDAVERMNQASALGWTAEENMFLNVCGRTDKQSIKQSSFIHGITSLKMLFQWVVYIPNIKRLIIILEQAAE